MVGTRSISKRRLACFLTTRRRSAPIAEVDGIDLDRPPTLTLPLMPQPRPRQRVPVGPRLEEEHQRHRLQCHWQPQQGRQRQRRELTGSTVHP